MFYGMRLEPARAIAGVTQTELADATGVSQPHISMFARGERMLTEEYAARFAGALALPVEFFQIPPSAIPDQAIDLRKMKTASAKDTDRAKHLFKEAYRVAAQLINSSEIPRPTLPIVQDADQPLALERIEELAVELRRRLRVEQSAPIPNVTALLERSGIAVAPLVVPGAKESADQTKHFGASHWAGATEPALACYVPGSSGDRDRFTLMHELAHIVLHTFRPHVVPENRETEANLLASAILLPRPQIREAIRHTSTLKNLASAKATWGVSMQAIIMRGKTVGSLPEDRATMLFKQISARGWRKNEPVEIPHESPRLLRNLLEKQYGPDPFRDPTIHALALPATILQGLAPGQSKPKTQQPGTATNVIVGRFG